jgi:Arc/MetJ-type ribon-helix-helix transcriptional regulator
MSELIPVCVRLPRAVIESIDSQVENQKIPVYLSRSDFIRHVITKSVIENRSIDRGAEKVAVPA